MRTRVLPWLLPPVALLSLVGCSTPALWVLQRAQPVSGTVLGAGGGCGTGFSPQTIYPLVPRVTFCRVRTGDGFVTLVHGNGRQSLFLNLGWNSYTELNSGEKWQMPFAQVGKQWLIASSGQWCTSVLYAGGLQRLADLALMQDIGPCFTGALGFGFYGALAGVALHVRPARRLQCNLSAYGAFIPWAKSPTTAYEGGLNLSLEYLVSSKVWRLIDRDRRSTGK